jgi:hypothetical protein
MTEYILNNTYDAGQWQAANGLNRITELRSPEAPDSSIKGSERKQEFINRLARLLKLLCNALTRVCL